jgi:hypothetical protein
MATAEQIKALLRSYVDGDGELFLTISMQVAAHAARKGQARLAQERRELIDEAKHPDNQIYGGNGGKAASGFRRNDEPV